MEEKLKEQLLSKTNVFYENEEIYSVIKEGYIDIIIEELLDTTLNSIENLDERETYIFRKSLGIFDNGIKQTLKSIRLSINNEINEERIRKIILGCYLKIFRACLRNKNIKDNKEKMSSAQLYEGIDDISISKLRLGESTEKKLRKLNIKTLYDLLSYSKNDLLMVRGIGETTIDKVFEILNNLGFKTTDDLTQEEKENIIEMSTASMIKNSSIGWILKLSRYKLYDLSWKKANTIEGIIKHKDDPRLLFSEEKEIISDFEIYLMENKKVII